MRVKIADPGKVPKYCYFRFDDCGCAKLIVYTVSADGRYMIAEGHSDRTCFTLLKILQADKQGYVAEYVGCCSNPADELSTHLCAVHWYVENGFCKLEFFDMESMLPEHDQSRRIYF